jgi:hypothetical protein
VNIELKSKWGMRAIDETRSYKYEDAIAFYRWNKFLSQEHCTQGTYLEK